MSFPLVPIAAIPTQGLRTSVGDWARAAAAEGLDGTVLGLDGSLELVRRGPHLLARGEVTLDARLPCARCGELLDWAMSTPFAVVYSPLSSLAVRPEDDAEGGPEVPSEFAGEADEVGEYEGDTFDLRQVVQELCAVEKPARLRCVDLDPATDDACAARWKARVGPIAEGSISPFSALKALKPEG